MVPCKAFEVVPAGAGPATTRTAVATIRNRCEDRTSFFRPRRYCLWHGLFTDQLANVSEAVVAAACVRREKNTLREM